jgi:hypothetical protein
VAKKALRNLSDKLPTADEIKTIMQGLREEKDYAVAIVASSILDARLEDLLKSKIRVKDKEVLDQLFSNSGILATFNARIVAAHAFGVITSPLAKQLHAIRSIRNVFAHAKFSISFDNKEVETEILSTNIVTEMMSLGGEPKLKLSNKGWFLLAVEIVLIIFDTLKLSPKDPDSALADALFDS